MGITGLIPFVKKSTKEIDLQALKGNVVAVDAYCWLHKGAFSCAEKLIKGEKTDGYVVYSMKYVSMLLNFGLKPILVFDGQRLPSKAGTEKKRRESRVVAKQKGKALLAEGKHGEAVKYFQAAVDVTSAMALELIQACRSVNVDCIVAPYEADAQLAYLARSGIAQVVITEDSDLIAFGCEKVLFKLSLEGRGVLYDRALLNETLGAKADQFTLHRFRQMCILSGCDYLTNLPGIGLGKAFQFFSKLKPSIDVYSALSLLPNYLKKPSLIVPKEYKAQFEQADNTFLYQLVYDPVSRNIVPLNPYPPGKNASDFPYAGLPTTPRKAFNLAVGNLDVNTLEAMDFYDPDHQEANILLRQSYSWSNTVKRAPHPSIWRSGYSSQDVFKSPRKTPKKSPRKLAFTATAERTLITSFLISPRKKRAEKPSENHVEEINGIMSQYKMVSQVSSAPPGPSPEKPKKMRIETDYSSVEWTPTKIRKKDSGSWLVEDEESPIGSGFSTEVDGGMASEDLTPPEEHPTPVSSKEASAGRGGKNPFAVTSSSTTQTKRIAYSALSVFEKMRMSRTESNQIVVTSKYFASDSEDVQVGKKRKFEKDEDRSCFDYMATSQVSQTDICVSADSPSALLDLVTPEKQTDETPDFESPVIASKTSARRLNFASASQTAAQRITQVKSAKGVWSPKKTPVRTSGLKKQSDSKQRNLFQSFAYQKSANFSKIKSKTEKCEEISSDLAVVLTSDDEGDSVSNSSTLLDSTMESEAPEKMPELDISPVKSPVFARNSSSQKNQTKSSSKFTAKHSGKLKVGVGKQASLFDLFGRKK